MSGLEEEYGDEVSFRIVSPEDTAARQAELARYNLLPRGHGLVAFTRGGEAVVTIAGHRVRAGRGRDGHEPGARALKPIPAQSRGPLSSESTLRAAVGLFAAALVWTGVARGAQSPRPELGYVDGQGDAVEGAPFRRPDPRRGRGAAPLAPVARSPRHRGRRPSPTRLLTWSETENVRWKVPLDGTGHAARWCGRSACSSPLPCPSASGWNLGRRRARGPRQRAGHAPPALRGPGPSTSPTAACCGGAPWARRCPTKAGT